MSWMVCPAGLSAHLRLRQQICQHAGPLSGVVRPRHLGKGDCDLSCHLRRRMAWSNAALGVLAAGMC
jgi:hypothetical protein